MPSAPRWLRAATLALLAAAPPSRAPADQSPEAPVPLEVGLAPYIGTRPLLTLFQPLATHLQKRLGREEQTCLTGMRAPTDAELKALDPYAQEHRQLLNETSVMKPSSP